MSKLVSKSQLREIPSKMCRVNILNKLKWRQNYLLTSRDKEKTGKRKKHRSDILKNDKRLVERFRFASRGHF